MTNVQACESEMQASLSTRTVGTMVRFTNTRQCKKRAHSTLKNLPVMWSTLRTLAETYRACVCMPLSGTCKVTVVQLWES